MYGECSLGPVEVAVSGTVIKIRGESLLQISGHRHGARRWVFGIIQIRFLASRLEDSRKASPIAWTEHVDRFRILKSNPIHTANCMRRGPLSNMIAVQVGEEDPAHAGERSTTEAFGAQPRFQKPHLRATPQIHQIHPVFVNDRGGHSVPLRTASY